MINDNDNDNETYIGKCFSFYVFTAHHPVNPVVNFTILSRGGSSDVLDIKESIMIKKLNPRLNDNIVSAPLFLYN